MQLGVVAHMAAGDHQMGKAQDILPAVPAVKGQQHIAADGQIQRRARILRRQHFQRENGVVPLAAFGLFHLPAADFQRRDGLFFRQRGKAAAHLDAERTGSTGAPLEGRDPGGHDHDFVRLHPRRSSPQIVHVAVVGRVEAAAVQKDPHFSRSA